MSAYSGKQLAKSISPFERLNDRYRSLNGEMEELISRLRNKLHSLSDTNVPPNPTPLADKMQEQPFREGHLMSYNNQLDRQDRFTIELREQVTKLESLI